MKNIYKFSVIVYSLLLGLSLSAQDAHLSQYDASPVLLNPALTGITEEGDFRIAANYRSQWGSISSASYTTTGISLDMSQGARWGIGGYIVNNDLGGFINAFNIMLSGSYLITAPTQSKYRISTGLQAGIMLKQLDEKEFIFDSQYEDGNFEEDNPSGEAFQNTSNYSPDINWGIAYSHIDDSWKVKPYAGVSVYHISMPKESFTSNPADNLPIRWVFNLGAKYDINDKLRIIGRSLFMMQRDAKEINFGAIAYYQFNSSNYTLICGLDARWQDAAIITLGVKHKSITYKLSYDANTSSLNKTSNGRGGTEMSIVYTPKKLRNSPKVY
jgi:type IX secretion system PorP/SprF family membrane protein